METQKTCRVCLSESDFNVPLNGAYCRRTNMINKINVCLKIVMKEADARGTICYRCAENIERYFEFITAVKKAQSKPEPRLDVSLQRRQVTYVREEVYDADFSFSFLDHEEKETKPSTPLFSFFSPPSKALQKSSEPVWKTPRAVHKPEKQHPPKQPARRKDSKRHQHSGDLFASQSQDDQKTQEWRLTPIENIIKQVRDKCFGRSEF